MKLLFFGDCMFGRNGRHFIDNPFTLVENIIKQVDYVFMNLETVISEPLLSERYKTDKVFNYQAAGNQMRSLRSITQKPIFVSIANNHSLDFGTKGYQKTKKFLKLNKFLHASGKRSVCTDDICFVNASDHCGCKNKKEWGKSIWIIEHDNLEPVLSRIKNLAKNGKFIVFSIHWGPNYSHSVSEKMKNTGRRLIDAGVGVVFGHSAHHVTSPPIELYENGAIIYGLGDFVNDYAVDNKYKSDRALMCLVDLQEYSVELIPVKRDFVISGSSVPKIIK